MAPPEKARKQRKWSRVNLAFCSDLNCFRFWFEATNQRLSILSMISTHEANWADCACVSPGLTSPMFWLRRWWPYCQCCCFNPDLAEFWWVNSRLICNTWASFRFFLFFRISAYKVPWENLMVFLWISDGFPMVSRQSPWIFPSSNSAADRHGELR